MAASYGFGNGYRCDLFFSPLSDDLKCGLCKQVARCPNISSCCGEHFCEACIGHLIEEGKDCPSCGLDEFSYFADKRVQKKLMALDVRCTMKDRGCEWTGKLEHLDSHLEARSGDCMYVDVPCPNKCGDLVRKDELANHLSTSCTEREYGCKYCNFRATYRVIVENHVPECPRYPVPCPNGCRVMTMEQRELKDHLKLCPLEEVDCEFSHTGCNVTLVREDMDKHMAENTQRHLVLMNRALQASLQHEEAKVKQLTERIAAEHWWMQEQLERSRAVQERFEVTVGQLMSELHQRDKELMGVKERMARLEEKLEQKERQIKQIERRFGVQITVPNFTALLTSRRCWISTPRSIYPGNHKVYIKVWPNGWQEGAGSHVSVWLNIAKGDYIVDTEPIADCIVTVQLLNQYRDQDHITVKRRFQWNRQHDAVFTATISNTFIPHTDLDWDITRQTQYLRNNSLQFKITECDVLNF